MSSPRSDTVDRRVSFAPSLDCTSSNQGSPEKSVVLSPRNSNIQEDEKTTQSNLSHKNASFGKGPGLSPVAPISVSQAKREVDLVIHSKPTEETSATGCNRAPWTMIENINFFDNLCSPQPAIPYDKENLLSPTTSSDQSIIDSGPRKNENDSNDQDDNNGNEEDYIDDEAFLPEKIDEKNLLPLDEEAFLPSTAEEAFLPPSTVEDFFPASNELGMTVDDQSAFLPKDDVSGGESKTDQETIPSNKPPQQITCEFRCELETTGSKESEDIPSLRSTSEDAGDISKKVAPGEESGLDYSRSEIEMLRKQLKRSQEEKERAVEEAAKQAEGLRLYQDNVRDVGSCNSLRLDTTIAIEQNENGQSVQEHDDSSCQEGESLKNALSKSEECPEKQRTDDDLTPKKEEESAVKLKREIIQMKHASKMTVQALQVSLSQARQRLEQVTLERASEEKRLEKVITELQSENQLMRSLNNAQSGQIIENDRENIRLQHEIGELHAAVEEQKKINTATDNALLVQIKTLQDVSDHQLQQIAAKDRTIGELQIEKRKLETTVQEQNQLNAATDTSLRADIEAMKAKIVEQKETITSKDQDLKKAERKLEVAAEEQTHLSASNYSLRNEISALKAAITDKLVIISGKDEQLKDDAERIDAVTKENEQLNNLIESLRAETQQKGSTIESQQESIGIKDQELNNMSKRLESAGEEQAKLSNTVDALTAEIGKMKSTMEEYQNSMSEKYKELEEARLRLENITQEQLSLSGNINSVKTAEDQMNATIKELYERLCKKEQELKESQELVEVKEIQETKMTGTAKILQNEVEQLKQCIEDYQRSITQKEQDLDEQKSKLEAAAEEETRLNGLIASLQIETGQSKAAAADSRNLRDDNESLRQEVSDLCATITTQEASLCQKEKELQESLQRLDNLQEQIRKMESSIKEHQESFGKEKVELKEEVEELEAAFKEQLELNSMVDSLREENVALKSTVERYAATIEQKDQEMREKASQLERDPGIEELQKIITKKDKELQDALQKLGAAINEQQALKQSMEGLRTETEDMQSVINDQREILAKKDQEIKEGLEKIENAFKKKEELSVSLEEMKAGLDEKEETICKKDVALVKMKQEIAVLASFVKRASSMHESSQHETDCDKILSSPTFAARENEVERTQTSNSGKNYEPFASIKTSGLTLSTVKSLTTNTEESGTLESPSKSFGVEIEAVVNGDEGDRTSNGRSILKANSSGSETWSTNSQQLTDVLLEGVDGDMEQIEAVLNSINLKPDLAIQKSVSASSDRPSTGSTRSSNSVLDKVGIFKVAFRQFELEKERIEKEARAEKEKALAAAQEKNERDVAELRAKLEEEKRLLEEENRNLLKVNGRCLTRSSPKAPIKQNSTSEKNISKVSGVSKTSNISGIPSPRRASAKPKVQSGLSRTTQVRTLTNVSSQRPSAIKTTCSDDDAGSSVSKAKSSLQRAVMPKATVQAKNPTTKIPTPSMPNHSKTSSLQQSGETSSTSSLQKAVLNSPKSKKATPTTSSRAIISQSTKKSGTSRSLSSRIPKVSKNVRCQTGSHSSKIPGRSASKLVRPSPRASMSGIPKLGIGGRSVQRLPIGTTKNKTTTGQSGDNFDSAKYQPEIPNASASDTDKLTSAECSNSERNQTSDITFSSLEETFSSLMRTKQSFTPTKANQNGESTCNPMEETSFFSVPAKAHNPDKTSSMETGVNKRNCNEDNFVAAYCKDNKLETISSLDTLVSLKATDVACSEFQASQAKICSASTLEPTCIGVTAAKEHPDDHPEDEHSSLNGISSAVKGHEVSAVPGLYPKKEQNCLDEFGNAAQDLESSGPQDPTNDMCSINGASQSSSEAVADIEGGNNDAKLLAIIPEESNELRSDVSVNSAWSATADEIAVDSALWTHGSADNPQGLKLLSSSDVKPPSSSADCTLAFLPSVLVAEPEASSNLDSHLTSVSDCCDAYQVTAKVLDGSGLHQEQGMSGYSESGIADKVLCEPSVPEQHQKAVASSRVDTQQGRNDEGIAQIETTLPELDILKAELSGIDSSRTLSKSNDEGRGKDEPSADVHTLVNTSLCYNTKSVFDNSTSKIEERLELISKAPQRNNEVNVLEESVEDTRAKLSPPSEKKSIDKCNIDMNLAVLDVGTSRSEISSTYDHKNVKLISKPPDPLKVDEGNESDFKLSTTKVEYTEASDTRLDGGAVQVDKCISDDASSNLKEEVSKVANTTGEVELQLNERHVVLAQGSMESETGSYLARSLRDLYEEGEGMADIEVRLEDYNSNNIANQKPPDVGPEPGIEFELQHQDERGCTAIEASRADNAYAKSIRSDSPSSDHARVDDLDDDKKIPATRPSQQELPPVSVDVNKDLGEDQKWQQTAPQTSQEDNGTELENASPNAHMDGDVAGDSNGVKGMIEETESNRDPVDAESEAAQSQKSIVYAKMEEQKCDRDPAEIGAEEQECRRDPADSGEFGDSNGTVDPVIIHRSKDNKYKKTGQDCSDVAETPSDDLGLASESLDVNGSKTVQVRRSRRLACKAD